MKIHNYMKRTGCKNELDLVNHVRSLLGDYAHWEIKVRAHIYSVSEDWKAIIEANKTVATIQKEIKSDFRDFTVEDAALMILSDYEDPSALKAIANLIHNGRGLKPLAHFLQYVDLAYFKRDDPVRVALEKERDIQAIKDVIE